MKRGIVILHIALAPLLFACEAEQETSERNGARPDTQMSATPDTLARDTAAVDGRSIADARHDTAEWSDAPIDVSHALLEIATVAEIRAGAQDRYDRFVVEMSNRVIPSYHAGYVKAQPIECGSGHPVEVDGNAVLELRMEPARGHNDRGESTVDHGERRVDLQALREAEISCDFEAVFTVMLGLDEPRPFRIMELQEPARIVLDVRKEQQ